MTSALAEPMLGEPWQLAEGVSLRPEPFGALAYNFTNRRLTFLKRPELVEVVRRLADAADVRAALVGAGVPDAQWPAYLAALRGLAKTHTIQQRDQTGTR